MVKTTKDTKMSKGNKENKRPLKPVKRRSEEKVKRSKKYVILTKKRHGKCGNFNNKKKKAVKQNTHVKVKNKSSIKTTSKKLEKTTIILEPTKIQEPEAKPYTSPIDYLNKVAHKSLHKVPLTRAELKHLFNKYKRDGHYRINTNLPSFDNIMDSPMNDTNVTSQTSRHSKSLDYKISSEDSNYNSPYTCEYSSMENPGDLQVCNDLRLNDMNTDPIIEEDTPVNEVYKGSFSNTYIMSYKNINIPSTLQDPARMQSSDSFSQFYMDNENPYDLSNRTSCSSTSDSNAAFNMSSFGNDRFQNNLLQGLESDTKNNLNDYSNLRNCNFIDSYIPPINPTLYDSNNDCLNIHNNESIPTNKDNGFVDKLYNVITNMWDNKQLSQVFPSGNTDSSRQNTNNTSLCPTQSSTLIENQLKQNGVPADMNNMYVLPQVKDHVYNPYKNDTDMNHNFSTVVHENTLRAPTFMTAPALAPNYLYDVNNF